MSWCRWRMEEKGRLYNSLRLKALLAGVFNEMEGDIFKKDLETTKCMLSLHPAIEKMCGDL